MINFRSVYIEGFGSITGELTYQLDKIGLNIISGNNGGGKTTILSALSWALFAQTLKNSTTVNTWEHKRPKTYKGTKVNVIYNINDKTYEVIRCKNYTKKIEGIKGASKLFLYIDGKYQDHLRDVKDVQAEIIKSLGMSFKLFRNSVLFGQKMTRLLSEKGDEQKKIFDEAFSTEFINKGREEAKINLKLYEDDLREHNSSISHLKDILLNLKREKKNLKDVVTSFHSNKIENLNKIKSRIKQKELFLISIEQGSERYYNLEDEIRKLNIKLTQLKPKLQLLQDYSDMEFRISLHIGPEQGTLDYIKQDLKKQESLKLQNSKRCNECGSVLDKEKLKNQKKRQKEKIAELNEKMKAQLEIVSKLKKELYSLDQEKRKYADIKNHNKELSNSLESAKRDINSMDRPESASSIKVDIKTLKKDYKLEQKKELDSNISSAIKGCSKKLKGSRSKLKELSTKTKAIEKKVDVHKWIVSDALSNKGLKAFIFKNMIKTINNILRYYKKYLGFEIRFNIDLDSATKSFNADIYKEKGIVDYRDLSGGEQQLVDVVLAFSINESYTMINPINILGLDEIFESLDENNIPIISEILYNKSTKLAIHLITHRKEFISQRIVQKIEMNNSSGTSSIV